MQKTHDYFITCRKGFWHNPQPFQDKVPEEIWDTGDTFQLNRGNLEQEHRQHQTKWKKVKAFILKWGTRQHFLLPLYVFITLLCLT